MPGKRWTDEEMLMIKKMKDSNTPKQIVSSIKQTFNVERTEQVIRWRIEEIEREMKRKTVNSPVSISTTISREEVDLSPASDDSSLGDFIPKNIETNYLERKDVLGQVESIMKLPVEKRKPIFVVGDTGTGKTAMGRYLAYKHKLPMLLVQIDASLNFNDLLYKVNFVNATATYEPGLFVKFLQEPSLIILDELPSATPEIFFKLHELLQEKRIFIKELGKVIEQHPQCYIYATGNFRNSLYIGNNKMNEALIKRFMTKVLDDFSDNELDQIIQMDNKSLKRKLLQFYKETKDICKKQNKKFLITIRDLQSITHLLNERFSLSQALHWGFLDSIMVNNNAEDKKAMLLLAFGIFPELVAEMPEECKRIKQVNEDEEGL